MQPQKFYIITVFVVVDLQIIFWSHYVDIFVIYVATKLHMTSLVRSLHTAIIKLNTKKSVTQILCFIMFTGAKANAAQGLSPLFRFLYYLWIYGTTP
jgi:hypothetical protein